MASSSRPRDPYAVLMVERGASPEDIKAQYKRLALRVHPDREGGDAEAFAELSDAYAVLADPNQRRAFDAGGWAELAEAKPEIDASALGVVDTVVAAAFSRMGAQLRTAVSSGVIASAREGAAELRPLHFGEETPAKVERHGAVFFELEVTPEQAREGIAVHASSAAKGRFKLLMFRRLGDGGLELARAEDSAKMTGAMRASMYFLDDPPHRLNAPEIGSLEDADDVLFRRLDGLEPCHSPRLMPGWHIFAVYGDNWFGKTDFTISAQLIPEESAAAASWVSEVDSQLVQKKAELAEFESEYKEARARWEECQERYRREEQLLGELLLHRARALEAFGSGAGSAAAYTAKKLKKKGHSRSASWDGSGLDLGAGDKGGRRKWFQC